MVLTKSEIRGSSACYCRASRVAVLPSLQGALVIVLRAGVADRLRIGRKMECVAAVIDLPSPSRHIYNPLTTLFAFRRSSAFDRVRQHPVKVDGTFA